jgi:hypothetical protein
MVNLPRLDDKYPKLKSCEIRSFFLPFSLRNFQVFPGGENNIRGWILDCANKSI